MPVSSVTIAYGVGGAIGSGAGYVLGRLHAWGKVWQQKRRDARIKTPLHEELERLKSEHSLSAASQGHLGEFVVDDSDSDGSVYAESSPVAHTPVASDWPSLEQRLGQEARQTLARLPNWNFDARRFAELPDVAGKPLYVVGSHLVQHSAWGTISEAMLITPFSNCTNRDASATLRQRVCCFLGEIEDKYLDVPFHNNVHACDVMQTANCFFETKFFGGLLRERLGYRLLTLLAGAVSSVGHTGQTNTFHVATESDLAITYNDTLPLENHHAATAFHLMRNKPETDWLSMFQSEIPDPATGRKRQLRTRLRRNLISMIMATDTSRHAERVTKLKEWVQDPARPFQDVGTSGTVSGCGNSKWQLFALETTLHAANLSHPTKVPSIAMAWSQLVFEEMWMQGKQEHTRLGCVMNPAYDVVNMDVATNNALLFEHVTLKLYQPLARLMPELLARPVDQLKHNIDYWKERKAKGKREPPKPNEYPPDPL